MKTTATIRGTHAESFRLFLQTELARRCAENPQYSLRAFALDLGTDHSSLGQMLRGARRLTEATIRRLARAFALPEERVEAFVAAERLEAAALRSARRDATELAAATVQTIAEWYHFAILELTRLESFRADSRWIARVLGIEVDEVNLALQRLLRLGLLEMSERERWSDLSGDTLSGFEGFTSATLERYVERTRELLAASLQAPPGAASEHSVTTLAVSRARLPEAIERVARLRAELLRLFADDAALDDVYRLEIHLYPLTHLHQEREDGTTGRPLADPLP